ncbi:DEAD/DEAH box helicase [Halobacteriovorax sp. HLS]|uniref:DEAD/DEAH box helicase n=1 Tax=Halobacteriovorax sp. HLS TaxID=2234000 RepID=UPI000FD851FB|nr:DEAD/DEAH box helicase [Halobacteriovorax sp. HLS]
MLNDIFILPAHLEKLARRFFNESEINQAKKFLSLSCVNLSFTKGSPETYYIVSGIVRQDRSHECKVVYKKRLEDTEEGPYSSNCDCHDWEAKRNCAHTCALFLGYHLQLEGEAPRDESSPPIPNFGLNGVNVIEYGTIIKGPHQLQGAAATATYSSLHYLLHNKKVVNFPLPDNFEGKVILSILSPNDERAVPKLKFKHKRDDGSICEEISLFENLYLFDWNLGRAFHLSSDLKTLIQKIKIRGNTLEINDLIKMAMHKELSDKCEIYLDGTPLEEVKEINANCRVTLTPGERRGLIDVEVVFHDDNEKAISAPDFLTSFTFEGGLLSNFKKKKDAYDFIGQFSDHLEDQIYDYKKSLHSAARKEKWLDIINYTLNNEKTYIYDIEEKEICDYNNEFLSLLISSLYKNFGELFFRYSQFNPATKSIHFQATTSAIFQGLNAFNEKVTPYGVNIFYEKQELANWNSKIRFERRASSTKWFDLELYISKEDLAIISQADLETGLALTDKGLVLLNKEQKDLMRFMRKYTKFEGQASENEESTDIPFKKFLLPFNRARIFELFELKKLGIEGALTKEEEELCERLATLESVPDYDLPVDLSAELRPYQKTGYNWLKFLYENKLGACLADDMGLGKTLQTISFIQSIHDQIDRVLVVCPVSILLNWQKEIEKFSKLNIQIYHGGERNINDDAKVILTSYGVMKREIDEKFSQMHFDVLVLDEVQHLKNIRSLGAYAARKIKADFRICLTGTPVENDLAEFYNIIDLSVPGIWGDLEFIRTTSNKKSRLVARKTAAPFVLRRTKDQVLTDLPAKIENNVYLNFDDGERQTYVQNLLNIKNRIKNSPSKKKYGEILKGLLQLRQSCLWQAPGATPHYKSIMSTKVEFLVEQLEQIIEEGHQTIVFSQFTTYLDLIQNTLRDKHWRLSRIDGSQSIKKRQQQVDEFQAGKTDVFLISLKAGGVGLNLTAASYVFIMDPWWNPAVESQAIDRAHRIGQQNTLTVYRPIIKDTVEEKVLQLQEMKKQLFKDLLPDDDESLFTGKLSLTDFEDLFS